MNISKYLKERKVEFEKIDHSPTYDAQHLAHEVHVSGHDVAKTVLLRARQDGDRKTEYVVAVLPASRNIDLDRIQSVLPGAKVELATEEEIKQQCPDCDFGVVPPFGREYGMRTLVDDSFGDDDRIVFEGNAHDEAIRMRLGDFTRIEKPSIVSFATDPAEART